MNRAYMIQELEKNLEWDICIIGGGAVGLGTAVDAATRGLKTILVEQADFAKGTSSKATKLVHGGVRYLQQGNIKLVKEALRERGLLLKNAPHLATTQAFIIPAYKWWEGSFYTIGLKIYNLLAGKSTIGPVKWLNKQKVLQTIPTLNAKRLRGGVMYYDGQFDDSRLAINLAQTAAVHQAAVINYMQVTGFLKHNEIINGVLVSDTLSGNEYTIKAKTVINATGVFADGIFKMDDAKAANIITPSQGIHIVLDQSFLNSTTAIMIPKTTDGRVLFAIPWHKYTLLGTTDTPVKEILLEPKPLQEEIDFIMNHAAIYLSRPPKLSDVQSVFTGMRPLVKSNAKNTKDISRSHLIKVSHSKLISIIGGKWTTYRQMAEEVVNEAIVQGGLNLDKPCATYTLKIHGWKLGVDFTSDRYQYGADEENINMLIHTNPGAAAKIHSQLAYTKAEIIWAVKNEMCMTVEDALARRTRALFLNAHAAIAAAPLVAAIMAAEMSKDAKWIEEQVTDFTKTAKHYIIT
jgi:glycerol-3-phosphate dehydrogenase